MKLIEVDGLWVNRAPGKPPRHVPAATVSAIMAAFGRRGGKVNSKAQQAARVANANYARSCKVQHRQSP